MENQQIKNVDNVSVNEVRRSFEDLLGNCRQMTIRFSLVATKEYGKTWNIEIFIDSRKYAGLYMDGNIDKEIVYAIFGCLHENRESNRFAVTLPAGVKVKTIHYDIDTEEPVAMTVDNNVIPTVENADKEDTHNSITQEVLDASISKEDEEATVKKEEKIDLDKLSEDIEDIIGVSEESEQDTDDDDDKSSYVELCDMSDDGDWFEYIIKNHEALSKEEIDEKLSQPSTYKVYSNEDREKKVGAIMAILDYTFNEKKSSFYRRAITDYTRDIKCTCSERERGRSITRQFAWLVKLELCDVDEAGVGGNDLYKVKKSFYEIFTKKKQK